MKNFTICNDNGTQIRVSLGLYRNLFDYVSEQEGTDFINSQPMVSYCWDYNGKTVHIGGNGVSIYAYPTIEMDYVVAISEKGTNELFKPPNNAVIYNLDGSIHKVLEFPELVSERALTQIADKNYSNPPLELVKYEFGLNFLSFGWREDNKGNLFNHISVQYNRDYGESRILNPHTGEIGECVDDWQNYL